MLLKRKWGSTNFKCCIFILRYRLFTSFSVCLTTSHVIRSSGLRFVAGFQEFAGEARVSDTNFVAMRPTVIAL
jgi:hypothetical protein